MAEPMNKIKVSKSLKAFKARALERPEVRTEYDRLADEFALLEKIFKAHAASARSAKSRAKIACAA